MTDYTPQHFILSHQPKFKDLDSAQPAAEANNYATMPVAYKAHASSNDSPDHFHPST